MVPTEEKIPSFLKGLFGVGLVAEAAQSRFEIFKSIYQFDVYFKKHIKQSKDLKVFMPSFPLFIAYKNKINNAFELVNDFLSNPQKMDLQEVLLKLRYDDFDEIANMHRNKTRYVDTLSKL